MRAGTRRKLTGLRRGVRDEHEKAKARSGVASRVVAGRRPAGSEEREQQIYCLQLMQLSAISLQHSKSVFG